MRNVAKRIIEANELKLKVYIPVYSDIAYVYLRSIRPSIEKDIISFKRTINENDQQTNSLCLTKVLFIEIMNNWIKRQNVFGERKFRF
jgi:hypothetical protein